MFCHVTLKLGDQNDFRFHCHALIPVKFGLQKSIVYVHNNAKFCFRYENCASASIFRDTFFFHPFKLIAVQNKRFKRKILIFK